MNKVKNLIYLLIIVVVVIWMRNIMKNKTLERVLKDKDVYLICGGIWVDKWDFTCREWKEVINIRKEIEGGSSFQRI